MHDGIQTKLVVYQGGVNSSWYTSRQGLAGVLLQVVYSLRRLHRVSLLMVHYMVKVDGTRCFTLDF